MRSKNEKYLKLNNQYYYQQISFNLEVKRVDKKINNADATKKKFI